VSIFSGGSCVHLLARVCSWVRVVHPTRAGMHACPPGRLSIGRACFVDDGFCVRGAACDCAGQTDRSGSLDIWIFCLRMHTERNSMQRKTSKWTWQDWYQNQTIRKSLLHAITKNNSKSSKNGFVSSHFGVQADQMQAGDGCCFFLPCWAKRFAVCW
jgi:hypothetical protein